MSPSFYCLAYSTAWLSNSNREPEHRKLKVAAKPPPLPNQHPQFIERSSPTNRRPKRNRAASGSVPLVLFSVLGISVIVVGIMYLQGGQIHFGDMPQKGQAAAAPPPVFGGGPAKAIKQFAKAVVAGDPDLEAVRKYLEENSHSGQWDEVRWFGAAAITVPELSLARNWAFATNSSYNNYNHVALSRDLKNLKEADSIVRLRFRTHNKLGAQNLYDMVFAVKDGAVSTAVEDEYAIRLYKFWEPNAVDPDANKNPDPLLLHNMMINEKNN